MIAVREDRDGKVGCGLRSRVDYYQAYSLFPGIGHGIAWNGRIWRVFLVTHWYIPYNEPERGDGGTGDRGLESPTV